MASDFEEAAAGDRLAKVWHRSNCAYFIPQLKKQDEISYMIVQLLLNLAGIMIRMGSPYSYLGLECENPECLLCRGAKNREEYRNKTDREQGQGQGRSTSKY
ncbi:hypothetical protein llap_18113 [Limosa lapponica baueri]|uniref:Uncharacterized protein n=1 Tax=Limosa lapponica baueri TaxID=1758121 RepID=A0A2I0TCQ5_LIMLA|nr:hypothetical protein llap_18113 [Limosa lapponica baueri]